MTTDRHEWSRPGAVPVAPGVHRIPLPLPGDGLRAVNVYLLEDGADLVLIDGGWATVESVEQFTSALASLGRHPADVTRVLVTHVHRDHYTQAVELRRRFGARVSLGEGEAKVMAALQGPAPRSLGAQLHRLRECGAGEMVERLLAVSGDLSLDAAQWESPDDWLGQGEVVPVGERSLAIVATPGHTQGHLVFVDEGAGLLFAGDHVLPHITPSIGFEHVMAPLPLGDYLDSLARVRALPDLRLLPAHGPVAPSVHARVDELVGHHEQRLAACLRALADGAVTAFDAARVLRWTRREHRFDELDPYNQMLAVIETGAHLDLLVARGALRAELVEGQVRYAEPQ